MGEQYKKLYQTMAVIIYLCATWTILESIIYGRVEPRIVDDIMILLFAFVYHIKPKGE